MGTGLLQPGHLLVILVIVLIVLGPGKLPEVGSALGKGLREFKRTAGDADADLPPVSVAALSRAAVPVEAPPRDSNAPTEAVRPPS
jgi:sec-independent protein translocase protein TatA